MQTGDSQQNPLRNLGIAILATGLIAGSVNGEKAVASSFDHTYHQYAKLLRNHVMGTRVNHAKLHGDRAALDAVVADFGCVTASELSGWTANQQTAYLINAYNAFTLQAIADHYPIKARWFRVFTPHNSIKQISGVWTKLRWRAAGTDMTLDEIEHETLRAHYNEPRIHFAVNCAAVSCPPLRREPYTANQLDRQLILAARDYLSSDSGLQVDGTTLRISRIFNWYGEDFINQYAHLIDTDRTPKQRAIFGVIAKYGPPEASRLAQTGTAGIRFLKYDWSLNDTVPN